jgi:hypothetical protein
MRPKLAGTGCILGDGYSPFLSKNNPKSLKSIKQSLLKNIDIRGSCNSGCYLSLKAKYARVMEWLWHL